jgi:c-di-GMP-binding flagellar brake protein YcgR
MIERRASRREDLMQIVNYTPSPHTSHPVLKGWIKDWSQSGLCLMVLQPLKERQEIIVDSIVVPSSKRAVVRWQQNMTKDAYKVGVEFRR